MDCPPTPDRKTDSLLALAARESVSEMVEETFRSYTLLLDRLDLHGAEPEVRGAILEAATYVGEKNAEIENYIATYRQIENRADSKDIPTVSKLRAAKEVFLSSYMHVTGQMLRAI